MISMWSATWSAPAMFSPHSAWLSPSTSANGEPGWIPLTEPWQSSVADRPTIDVATPAGGLGAPWPNVAEIEAALPHDKWTLVGGLMAQLRGIHAGIDAVRPTNDIDIVLHVETTRGIASETGRALEALGYELAPSIDERNNTAHRQVRGVDGRCRDQRSRRGRRPRR